VAEGWSERSKNELFGQCGGKDRLVPYLKFCKFLLFEYLAQHVYERWQCYTFPLFPLLSSVHYEQMEEL